MGWNVRFTYADPCEGFDRSRVKGVVCELIEVRDARYTTAVEVCAGGKLFQVVVDNEKTGELLLKKGNLQRRVTIIPLNKIRYHTVPPQKVLSAQKLCPSGDACLALTLVGYDKSVQEAIEYVFGSTIVCDTLEAARKVAFDPSVRTRSVTVDGDVCDPSGVLEGGSRSRGKSVLSLLSSVNSVRGEVKSLEKEASGLHEELKVWRDRSHAYRECERRLELELHNLEVLDGSVESLSCERVKEEWDACVASVSQLEREVKEAEEAERAGQSHLSELEARLASFEKKGSDIDGVEEELKKSRLELKKALRACDEGESALEELRLELKEVQTESEELRERVKKDKQSAEEHEKAVETIESRVRSLKECYEEVKRALETKREEVKSVSEEIRTMEKRLESAVEALKRGEEALKTVRAKKTKVAKARSDAEKRVKLLLKTHPWLSSEESAFGQSGGDFDFAAMDVKSLRSRVEALEREQEELGRRLNKKVLGMMEKAESEYQELLRKREIIEKDRSQIEKVMEELDVKKRETLASTYAKVNRDFGSIFSTLLPGASARLEPPNGGSVLDGLEVRVSFGGKEKESLSELSGGQRSLLALSLVLSLLVFKPAPMYILDEVDAALDVSHTQNIGRMLREHFGGSQFIVVSLKEGMFNNANVIFRTKFVDGVSTVTRTVGVADGALATGVSGASVTGVSGASAIGVSGASAIGVNDASAIGVNDASTTEINDTVTTRKKGNNGKRIRKE